MTKQDGHTEDVGFLAESKLLCLQSTSTKHLAMSSGGGGDVGGGGENEGEEEGGRRTTTRRRGQRTKPVGRTDGNHQNESGGGGSDLRTSIRAIASSGLVRDGGCFLLLGSKHAAIAEISWAMVHCGGYAAVGSGWGVEGGVEDFTTV